MRGDYWNTREFQKWVAKIQIDTEDPNVGTTNGWGYVDDEIIDVALLFGARMPTNSMEGDDEDID